MLIKDQLGQEITVDFPPKRIISLVPSLTELLCDLGMRSQLVGVTKFCVHPDDIRQEKTIVGGTKKINISKVKQLKPDLVIANKEENTKAMIEELKGFVPVHISDISDLNDALNLITSYGILFDKADTASSIIKNIQLKVKELDTINNSSRIPTIAYFIWKDPWMVVGSKTYIHSMLGFCGVKNFFESVERYPEIDLSQIEKEQLDYIFLSSEPYPFTEQHITSLSQNFPHTKIKIVDGEMFSWYGSRIIKAFDYIKQLKSSL